MDNIQTLCDWKPIPCTHMSLYEWFCRCSFQSKQILFLAHALDSLPSQMYGIVMSKTQQLNSNESFNWKDALAHAHHEWYCQGFICVLGWIIDAPLFVHFFHQMFSNFHQIGITGEREGRKCSSYFWKSNDNNYLDVYRSSSSKGYKFQTILFGMTFSGSKFNWNVNLKLRSKIPQAHCYQITKCNSMYFIYTMNGKWCIIVKWAAIVPEFYQKCIQAGTIHELHAPCTWDDFQLMLYDGNGFVQTSQVFTMIILCYAVQIHKNKWPETSRIDNDI